MHRRAEKLNVFLEYTHLTVGPYVSADGLERLRDCIARYARKKALPDGLTPIRTEKLSNFDLFHFGWNMAEYFDRKREDRQEIGGQLLVGSVIGEIDRLDAIGVQAGRTAETYRQIFDSLKGYKLQVDTDALDAKERRLPQHSKSRSNKSGP